MSESLLSRTKRCYICGAIDVEKHHIFFGTAKRKISDTERINLIRKVANSEGLFGILRAIESEFNIEIPELDKDLHEDKKQEQVTNNNDAIVSEALPPKSVVEPVINPSIITNPKEASIYREEAKALVEQDRLDHPVIENQETISGADPVVPQADEICEKVAPLEEHPKVLERVKNNPWSGIETVSPGQLKL